MSEIEEEKSQQVGKSDELEQKTKEMEEKITQFVEEKESSLQKITSLDNSLKSAVEKAEMMEDELDHFRQNQIPSLERKISEKDFELEEKQTLISTFEVKDKALEERVLNLESLTKEKEEELHITQHQEEELKE